MEEEKSNNGDCLPPAESAPWLVYTHGNGRRKKFQTFCTLSSSFYTKSIPQLRGKFIIYSDDGWLLLRDFENLKIFTLWNPISSQLIHLPPLHLMEDGVAISCAVVSPPPEDGDARDVKVCVFGDGMAFSYGHCTDTSTWFAHRTELLGQRTKVRQAIMCNGVIYGYVRMPFGRQGNGFSFDLVIVEVNNHDFHGLFTLRLLHVGNPDPGFKYCVRVEHFLASCGQVYAIGIYSRYGDNKGIPTVIIWELNWCLVKWVPVECLEGRAFFIGSSCTWCWVSSNDNESRGVKQNCVYFEVSAHEEFGMLDICSYNLEDESLTCFMPCPNIPTFWKDPTWILPQYQRLGKDEGCNHCGKGLSAIKWQGLQEENEEEHTRCWRKCESY